MDERLAKALSHRLRVQILQRLEEAGEASPKELAQALGEPVGNVSYHVGILRELDCVELVRTEPRRGALAHFYRATVRPWLADEQWAALSAGFRDEMLSRTLSELVEQAATASREGGFDGPEAHVSRVMLAVDPEGLTELTALLTKHSTPCEHRDREHWPSSAGRSASVEDDRDRGRRDLLAP